MKESSHAISSFATAAPRQRVVVQFELTPQAFANSSPGLLQPWGFAEQTDPTLKAFAIWPTLSALNFFFSRVSQGCRKLQPWAEIGERLRRYFKLNQYSTAC
jgi:hypothetical protein